MAGNSVVGLSAEQIRVQYLAPGGAAYNDGEYHSGYHAANVAVNMAGGEPFNPGTLSKLIDDAGDDGDAVVWFHAQWFLRRLAARGAPPRKMVPLFLAAVKNDYPVNPHWPKFRRCEHGAVSDEERADMPTLSDSPKTWAAFIVRHGWTVEDVPSQAEAAINEAVKTGDMSVIRLFTEAAPESSTSVVHLTTTYRKNQHDTAY